MSTDIKPLTAPKRPPAQTKRLQQSEQALAEAESALAAAQAEVVTVYTDRTAWEAAAGGSIVTEDFNSIPGVSPPDNALLLVDGHNLVGDHPLDIERLSALLPPDPNNSIWPGTSSLTVDGTNFLRASLLDFYGPFKIHLPEPVTAYGGDFKDAASAGGLVISINDTDQHIASILGSPGDGFVGFVSTEPFSSLYFWTTDPFLGEGFGHDNLAWAPVAECPGDLDGDGFRDFTDFNLFAAAYGSSTGDPNYDPGADLDDNGFVDFTDFNMFASVYGVPCP